VNALQFIAVWMGLPDEPEDDDPDTPPPPPSGA
jgi:hypothetical protein